MRGPPFLLRGIPGRDSRSPSPYASPLIVWGESSLGGPSAWVGASKSRSGWQRTRAGSSNQSRERGAGQPVHRPPRALEARLLAAAGCGGRMIARRGTFLPLPALYRALSAPRPSWGARPPSALHWPSAPGRHGLSALATFSHQLRAVWLCGARTLLHSEFNIGDMGLGCRPRQLPSSLFLPPLRLSLYLSVSESVSFSNS